MLKMISRRSRGPLVWSLTTASLNRTDRLGVGRDQCVGRGYGNYLNRAWKLTDTDNLKLVNAVQDTKLAVAWHEIIFRRIDEPAHVRSAPE